MANLNLALTESKSLRDNKLSEVSNEKALETLNKAKALVFALWKGESVATTAQIAEFYEVPEDTVQTAIKNHRDEFEADGLKVLRGKALKDVVSSLDTTSKAPSLTAWNPRCALRLGMLLRDSVVAKSVRTVVLDCLEVIPQQSETIRELELRLQLANAEKDSAIAQKNLLDTRHYITTALPEPLQQKILGYELVEKVEYRDRIIYQNQVINDGSKINKTSLCRRYGFLKKGKPDYKALDCYLKRLPSDAFELSVYFQETEQLNRQFLPILDDLVRSDKQRQLWLGE